MDYRTVYHGSSLPERVIAELGNGALTRTQLCERLDVARTTLGVALSELFQTHAIDAVVQTRSERGRPTQTIQLASKTIYSIGMDVSRRRGVAIAVNRRGDPLATARVECSGDSSWIDTVGALCDSLAEQIAFHELQDSYVSHVGVGIPIPIGHQTWADRHQSGSLVMKLKQLIEAHWLAPILVDNTIRMAALGEARWGAGVGIDSQLYLRVSRGIIACATVRNVLTAGADGYAGEIGHITAPDAKERCVCGKQGCVETVASSDAICQQAGLEDLVQVQQAIEDKTHPSHEAALAALKRATEALAWAVSAAVMLINPSQVVLAGEVPSAIPQFEKMLQNALEPHLIPQLHQHLKVVLSQQDSLGCARGATAAVETYLQQKHLTRMLQGHRSK